MGHVGIAIPGGNDTGGRVVAVHRASGGVDPQIIDTPAQLWFVGETEPTIGLGTAHDPTARIEWIAVDHVGRQEAGTDGYRAEDLVAQAVHCVVAMVTAAHGGTVPSVSLAYPSDWGQVQLDLQHDAFAHIGLHGVRLVRAEDTADAVAAAAAALAASEAASAAPEVADTDTIPVVEQPKALAFSEATATQHAFTEEQAPTTSRRAGPLVIVTGVAVAVILASVGIAAALGTFDGTSEVSPPAITDAQQPAVTTTPSATPPAASIPFPTANPVTPEQAPALPSPSAPSPVMPSPVTPGEPDPTTTEVPAPAPAVPPQANVPRAPAIPTVPRFTYPSAPAFPYPTDTVPDYLQPGGAGVPDYLQPGFRP